MDENIGLLTTEISRLLRRSFDTRARSIGITRAQWRTLTTLSRHEGINQGRLADLLEVEPITLCRMIDRLEEAGHVERRRDPADRRAWKIFLTARSRPLIDRLKLIGDKVVDAALHGIAEPDRKALLASLVCVRDNLVDDDVQELAHG